MVMFNPLSIELEMRKTQMRRDTYSKATVRSYYSKLPSFGSISFPWGLHLIKAVVHGSQWK